MKYQNKSTWRKSTKKTSFINRHRFTILSLAGFAGLLSIALPYNLLSFEHYMTSEAIAQSSINHSPALQEPELTTIQVTEQTIRRIATKRGFKDVDNLIRLAKCESGLNPSKYAVNVHKQSNGKILTSVDRGLFQFSDYWRKDVSNECSFSAACSTNEAITTINARSSYDRWACAKKLGLMNSVIPLKNLTPSF
jgi:hypothetical protein